MAYSGLGWSRKGGFQKPTLSGMKGAAGAIGGGIGGAALGGAAVVGGALARSTGATPLLAGLGIMGAGAVAGYKKFAAPKEEDKEDKKDTNEELKQTAAYGLLSVEKLDAIYNNVVDIREHLSDQDPVSQEREKALDAKVKNKELVDAIRGIGGGGAGGGGTKKNFDWAKILGLGALAGLGGLAFMNDDKLNKFFDKAPEWADSIQLAIENIMEFVRDLDGFFEGLGIEFGGAAAAGIGAGLRATNNRNRNARLARAAAAAEEKKKKARAKRDEARRNKQNAKAAARAAARARAAAKAAERAKIKEEARKARAERRRQRAQKLKTAAAKIKARYTASMSRIGGRPGGAPAKPSTTTAGQKTATAKRGPGRIRRGFGTAFKVMQRNKARVQQALLNERAETKRQAKESRQQKSQTRAARIKNVAQVASSKFISKMPRIGGRPSGSPVKPSATSAATKVSTPRRGPGRIKRGLTALTPVAKKLFGGRSTGMGGRAASSFPKIPAVTSNIMGRSSGMGGRPLSDFPEVKPVTQGAGRGRPGGAPTKPKIPPKLALALKVLPSWAFKVAANAGKAMGMVTGVAASKTAEYVLRIAGPILLAYEIFRLGQAWMDAPGDKDPFGDEPADIAFKQGMLRLGATYAGGYFGAVGTGMLTGMFTANPLLATGGAIVGGIGGALFGDKLMEHFLMTDEQKREKELNEKKTRLQFLKDNPVKLKLRGGGVAKAVKEARIKEMRQLQEEISVLESAGSLDGAGSVTVINNNSNQQNSNISMSGVSTTTIVDAHQDGTAIYDQFGGTARF